MCVYVCVCMCVCVCVCMCDCVCGCVFAHTHMYVFITFQVKLYLAKTTKNADVIRSTFLTCPKLSSLLERLRMLKMTL